jgi:hypothetical protein
VSGKQPKDKGKGDRWTMAKKDELPQTNPAEIELVIKQIQASNLEPSTKEKAERLLRTVMVLLNLLGRKICKERQAHQSHF